MTQLKLFTIAAALASLGAGSALAQTAAPAAAPAAPGDASTVALPLGTINANINITPKRVTFDPTRRTGTVYLFNQGDAPTTVDITLLDRVMMPDGSIVTAEDAQKSPERKAVADKLKPADGMVQLSPRRVTLEPGKGQTVRIRIGNLPDAAGAAEYRTHLTVTDVPPRDTGVTAAEAAGQTTKTGQLSFHVTTVFGVSIPVIIRTGAVDVRASLEHPRIETAMVSVDGRSAPKPTPVLVVDLVREGANSVYGVVQLTPAGVKNGAPLAVARGIAVYPEIGRRTVRVPLSREPKPGEKLEVTFTDDDTSPGKVLAKTDL